MIISHIANFALTHSSYISAMSGTEFVHKLFNPVDLLTSPPLNSFVVPAILAIIFIETGLLFPILPGDSLLVAGGVLLSQGAINPWELFIGAPIAAIAGDHCGYIIGRTAGNHLFRKEDSRFFKREYLERSQDFFKEKGTIAIILARFIPIIRTFCALIAGASKMPYRKFAIFDIIGGIAWTVGIILIGMWLGQIPFVKKNLDLIGVLIVLISITPYGWKWYKQRTAGT